MSGQANWNPMSEPYCTECCRTLRYCICATPVLAATEEETVRAQRMRWMRNALYAGIAIFTVVVVCIGLWVSTKT